ncbi:kinase-like protein [Tothia fuscella]|uniref:non-specific serine/threonine protein kinase n=1 Tax=Tothia fuscella TaxID=1048955 RepID=A0A9P4NWZ8_9PEZI|nr:kinase-like protein [Tothia fuscella]
MKSFFEPITTLYFNVRILVGRKLFGSFGERVTKISRKRVLKGPCLASELEAMLFVAQSTSIPIPKVHTAYGYHGDFYIEMDYIRGETLETAWRDSMSPEQKEELRHLQPPQPELVASAKGGGAVDCRIGSLPFGPYHSQDEFHSFLRGGIPLDDCTKVYAEAVTHCHSRKYRTCFCHADLAPRNIIVQRGRITGVVDWQFGGWYPEYWEYTKAHYSLYTEADWVTQLGNVMENYEEPLKAEHLQRNKQRNQVLRVVQIT